MRCIFRLYGLFSLLPMVSMADLNYYDLRKNFPEKRTVTHKATSSTIWPKEFPGNCIYNLWIENNKVVSCSEKPPMHKITKMEAEKGGFVEINDKDIYKYKKGKEFFMNDFLQDANYAILYSMRKYQNGSYFYPRGKISYPYIADNINLAPITIDIDSDTISKIGFLSITQIKENLSKAFFYVDYVMLLHKSKDYTYLIYIKEMNNWRKERGDAYVIFVPENEAFYLLLDKKHLLKNLFISQ